MDLVISRMQTALLIVDIQNDYFPGGKNELKGSVEAGVAAKKLLEGFREKQMPVIHVQHISTRSGATYFLSGTAGVEFNANVKPRSDEPVVIKHYPNSFRDTGLQEMLMRMGIERLVICGMMTHMCVDSTTRAAFDHGLACIVAHDACTTKDLVFKGEVLPAESVHRSFLGALDGMFARVASSDQVLKWLKTSSEM